MRLTLAGLLLALAPAVRAADPPAKPAPPPLSLTVTGDVDAALAPVAGRLTAVFFESYPKLLERFDNPDKPAPRQLKLTFRKGIKVPAFYSGGTVTVSVEWLTRHPDDAGMMTHELTHAVQAYPPGGPGWVTEGLADYARKRYGPTEQPGWALPARLTDRQSYKDSYRTAGRFFVWLDDKHPGTVDKLHRKMQARAYAADDFKGWTGKDLDALWADCVRDLAGAGK